jgi:hypothetical protein
MFWRQMCSMPLSSNFLVIVAILALAAPLATPQSPNMVEVLSTDLTPPDSPKTAVITLRNTSSQRVTAYTVAITGIYADGIEARQEVTVDLVWALAGERLGWLIRPDDRFYPRDIVHVTIGLPQDVKGRLPITAKAEVTMAAYADRTALGSRSRIRELGVSRKADADEFGTLVGDIEQLLQRPDPVVGLSESLAAQKVAMSKTGEDKDKNAMQRRMSLLQMTAGRIVANKEALRSTAAAYRARQAVLLDHAVLNGGN